MADFGGSVGGGEFFRGILQVSWASGEYSSSRVRARCAGGQAAACLRLSCARSWPACRRIQKSASDQPTRSNANASRGLILPVPAKSRCRVFLETPSRFAAVVTLHPVSSIAIRMVSPGCAGFNIAIAVPGFFVGRHVPGSTKPPKDKDENLVSHGALFLSMHRLRKVSTVR